VKLFGSERVFNHKSSNFIFLWVELVGRHRLRTPRSFSLPLPRTLVTTFVS
jgi:hypothetical protein